MDTGFYDKARRGQGLQAFCNRVSLGIGILLRQGLSSDRQLYHQPPKDEAIAHYI